MRQVERRAKAAEAAEQPGAMREALGSFSPTKADRAEIDAILAPPPATTPRKPVDRVELAPLPAAGGGFDVPLSIGKRC